MEILGILAVLTALGVVGYRTYQEYKQNGMSGDAKVGIRSSSLLTAAMLAIVLLLIVSGMSWWLGLIVLITAVPMSIITVAMAYDLPTGTPIGAWLDRTIWGTNPGTIWSPALRIQAGSVAALFITFVVALSVSNGPSPTGNPANAQPNASASAPAKAKESPKAEESPKESPSPEASPSPSAEQPIKFTLDCKGTPALIATNQPQTFTPTPEVKVCVAGDWKAWPTRDYPTNVTIVKINVVEGYQYSVFEWGGQDILSRNPRSTKA